MKGGNCSSCSLKLGGGARNIRSRRNRRKNVYRGGEGEVMAIPSNLGAPPISEENRVDCSKCPKTDCSKNTSSATSGTQSTDNAGKPNSILKMFGFGGNRKRRTKRRAHHKKRRHTRRRRN